MCLTYEVLCLLHRLLTTRYGKGRYLLGAAPTYTCKDKENRPTKKNGAAKATDKALVVLSDGTGQINRSDMRHAGDKCMTGKLENFASVKWQRVRLLALASRSVGRCIKNTKAGRSILSAWNPCMLSRVGALVQIVRICVQDGATPTSDKD